MTPDAIFNIANPLALLGWVALLVYPFASRIIGIFSGLVLPGVLSLGYMVVVLVYWGDAEGGYDSLSNVMLLLSTPGSALAGWIHFLAFDLFLGTWAAKMGQEAGIKHVFIIPSLILTFLFGPIGFLLTLLLIGLRRLRGPFPQEA